MKNDSKKASPEQQPSGSGRVSNIDGRNQGTDPARDISSIDRQEGEMENGETGGNFNIDKSSETPEDGNQ